CIRMELVFAGDGPLRTELEVSIKRHDLEDCIRITGWISSDKVREELMACRALVLPSFAEGLPVVIMEAMALRMPVLSTFVAGIPELVGADESGWLFPAGSIDDLTAALEDCLSRSADEIKQMGDRGFVRVTSDTPSTSKRQSSVRFSASLRTIRRGIETNWAAAESPPP
ncbi:MAG TPA: glycosyltransferase, partial [Steroidobacteraceae bacterium]|nr:glycosyltransferase [Steroidobacteraceae bacterium]